jgi:hypothetical protein
LRKRIKEAAVCQDPRKTVGCESSMAAALEVHFPNERE